MMLLWLVAACSAPSPAPAPAPEPPAAPAPVALTAPGLQLTQRAWSRSDGETGTAWVVHLPDPTLTVLPSDTLRNVPQFPTPSGDRWVHVNGGFYDTQSQPMSLVVHNGVMQRDIGSGSGIVTGPHPVHVIHRDAWQPGATEALQSIDRIVHDGVSLVSHRPNARRAARSILAVTDDGASIAILVDANGYQANGNVVTLAGTSFLGPTLAEAADFAVQELGARAALNLDGAVSTALIVHTPEGRFEVVGEQPVINAVRLEPRR